MPQIEQEEQKQAWTTPTLINFSVKDTAGGGSFTFFDEGTVPASLQTLYVGPASS